MPNIRVYIAQSLDGYIADRNGDIDWLRPFDDVDYGFAQFLKELGTIVMGRKTYDQIMTFGEWPYQSIRTLVLTSNPLDEAPPSVARVGTDAGRLVQALRNAGGNDVWILGGSQTLNTFVALDAIDRLDIFTVPVLLGSGMTLFKTQPEIRRLKLIGHQTYDKGLTRQSYSRA